MRRVAVIGAGMTTFGEHFDLGIKDLVPMAVTEAIDSVDKGLDRGDIDAAWFGELTTTDGFPSGIFADSCGLLDVPVTRVENACATGNDAIRNGVYGVASGMLDVVLVAGADKVRESSARGTFWEWMGLTRDMAWDYPVGVVAPANFALHVNRYLHESPATREHLAMVAVKNHHHGVSNPKAQMRFEITIEDVLNAPTVVEPFGLYDCTPQSDSAAATGTRRGARCSWRGSAARKASSATPRRARGRARRRWRWRGGSTTGSALPRCSCARTGPAAETASRRRSGCSTRRASSPTAS